MKTVDTVQIYRAVKQLAAHCAVTVNPDAVRLLKNALKTETDPNAKFALEVIIKNHQLAADKNMPACQDTGMALVFLQVGQDVRLAGEYVNDAIDRAVAEAYAENFLRKSVAHPLTRMNTNTNAPAVVHTEIVPGGNVTVSFMAKGFGCENMSRLFMLTPADGAEGIKNAVAQAVRDADGKPCPPLIVGVGIGGTAEKAMLLSKKALLREAGKPSGDPAAAKLEKEMLALINKTGAGVQGFGGCNTALAVAAEIFPTHIAGLPVAVTIQCHAARHGTVVI